MLETLTFMKIFYCKERKIKNNFILKFISNTSRNTFQESLQTQIQIHHKKVLENTFQIQIQVVYDKVAHFEWESNLMALREKNFRHIIRKNKK